MTLVSARIVEALRGRDTVIMIDEADYLSVSSLELVRRIINDKAQTGVVLVVLPRLKYKLENLRNDHEEPSSFSIFDREMRALKTPYRSYAVDEPRWGASRSEAAVESGRGSRAIYGTGLRGAVCSA
jgi:hypothetical protein